MDCSLNFLLPIRNIFAITMDFPPDLRYNRGRDKTDKNRFPPHFVALEPHYYEPPLCHHIL